MSTFDQQFSYVFAYKLAHSKYQHLIKDIIIFEKSTSKKYAVILDVDNVLSIPTMLSNDVHQNIDDFNENFDCDLKHVKKVTYDPSNLPVPNQSIESIIAKSFKTEEYYDLVMQRFEKEADAHFENLVSSLPIHKMYQIAQNINIVLKDYVFKYKKDIYLFNNAIFSYLPLNTEISSQLTDYFLTKILELDAAITDLKNNPSFNKTFKDYQIATLIRAYWDDIYNEELFLNTKNEYRVITTSFEKIKVLTQSESKQYLTTDNYQGFELN